MRKIVLFILMIINLIIFSTNTTFAAVEKGVLFQAPPFSFCMEFYTHALYDPCDNSFVAFLIMSPVDHPYLGQYVEVKGDIYYGVECNMIVVETITLLGDPNLDTDEDSVNNVCDNCWEVSNPDQLDSDENCPDPPYSFDPVCGDACECECDVSGDGQCTPQDALCSFQVYLGICPTACGDCEDICCDVTRDGQCTPADALCRFQEYLGIHPNCFDSPSPYLEYYSNSGCLDNSSVDADEYPFCGDDEVIAQAEVNTIYVTHKNAVYNCCPDDIEVSLITEGNVLKLIEKEVLTMPCACLCCYDIDSEITKVESGVYLIQVWNADQTEMFGEVDVIVE